MVLYNRFKAFYRLTFKFWGGGGFAEIIGVQISLNLFNPDPLVKKTPSLSFGEQSEPAFDTFNVKVFQIKRIDKTVKCTDFM